MDVFNVAVKQKKEDVKNFMTPRLINDVEMIVCVQRSEKGDSKTMNKSVIKRVICQTRRAGDGEGGGI